MLARRAAPEKLTGQDERKPVNSGAQSWKSGVGLQQSYQLGDFATFHDWQAAIRATVDLPILEELYALLNGPALASVAEGVERTEDRDRGWMQAWLYYEGSLRHLRTYAQPTHWKEYGATWEEATKRFGGSETLAYKLSQLRYDRPKWATTPKEVAVATKERKKAVRAGKVKPSAADGPLGFRAGSKMGKVAEKLLKEKQLTAPEISKLLTTSTDFIRAGLKRGVIKFDKKTKIVTLA